MRREKKEVPLILYEKYKRDHHLGGTIVNSSGDERGSISGFRRFTNLISVCILLGMIVLSTIGAITLLNPYMRMMLLRELGV